MSDADDAISGGRLFQMCAPEAEKAYLLTETEGSLARSEQSFIYHPQSP